MRYKELNEEELKSFKDKYGDYVQKFAKVGYIAYKDIRNDVGVISFSSRYITDKNPIGVVFYVDEKIIKIVSLTENRDSLAWCTKEALGYNIVIPTTEDDGSHNMDIIQQSCKDFNNDKLYPAFAYIRGLGENWYMPAKDELEKIYENKKKINNTLNLLSKIHGISANRLANDKYWSSSQAGDEQNRGVAWYKDLSGSESNDGYGKWREYHVRAVRAFSI